ncbi:MAG: MBL fold metallo-hydrolase [Promethearchaeota archaeon]
MKLPAKKTSIALISIIGIALIGSTTTVIVINADDITITFIPSNILSEIEVEFQDWMSSIMIEYKGIRIYVDPYNIDEDIYAGKKADAIFITHPHEDHWDQDTIDFLTQDSTEFVGPASCTGFISENDGTGVIPGDNGTVAGIIFEAIPAYNPSHPVEENWCGYVITIEEYSILLTGDTSNIPEYSEWRDRIDVLILPVGYGCSNLGPDGAIDAISVIKPTYVIPIHYREIQYLDNFLELVPLGAPDIEIYERELVLK